MGTLGVCDRGSCAVTMCRGPVVRARTSPWCGLAGRLVSKARRGGQRAAHA